MVLTLSPAFPLFLNCPLKLFSFSMKYKWIRLSLEVSPKTEFYAADLKRFKTNIFVNAGSSSWEELFINRYWHGWWHSWLKNVSLPLPWPPEMVFVNDEFVCKETISCKSMYLTLDFSLIPKTLSLENKWHTNYLQSSQEKAICHLGDFTRLAIPSHWTPVFLNKVPIEPAQQNKSGISVLQINGHRLILRAFSLWDAP